MRKYSFFLTSLLLQGQLYLELVRLLNAKVIVMGWGLKDIGDIAIEFLNELLFVPSLSTAPSLHASLDTAAARFLVRERRGVGGYGRRAAAARRAGR